MFSVVLWTNCKKKTINVIPSTNISFNDDGTASAKWANKNYDVEVLRSSDNKEYLEALDFIDGIGLVSPKKFGDARKRQQESEDAALSKRKKAVMDIRNSEILNKLNGQEPSNIISTDGPSACPQCTAFSKLSSKHIEVLQEIVECIKQTCNSDVSFPTLKSQDCLQSKVPLLPGSTIYIDARHLQAVTKTFRKDPKEMIRKIIKACIAPRKLENMTRTGKGNSEKIPTDLLEDTKVYVNKNVPKSLRINQKDFDNCITTMINTMKRSKPKKNPITLSQKPECIAENLEMDETDKNCAQKKDVVWNGYNDEWGFDEPLDRMISVRSTLDHINTKREVGNRQSTEREFNRDRENNGTNYINEEQECISSREQESESENDEEIKFCESNDSKRKQDEMKKKYDRVKRDDIRPKDDPTIIRDNKSEEILPDDRENTMKKDDKRRERKKTTENDSSSDIAYESETGSRREKYEEKDYSEEIENANKYCNERKQKKISHQNHSDEQEDTTIQNYSRKEENPRREKDSSGEKASMRERNIKRERTKKEEKAYSNEKESMKKYDCRRKQYKENGKHHSHERGESENYDRRGGNEKKEKHQSVEREYLSRKDDLKKKDQEKVYKEGRDYIKNNDNRGRQHNENEKHRRAEREKPTENGSRRENKKKDKDHSEQREYARRKDNKITRKQDNKNDKAYSEDREYRRRNDEIEKSRGKKYEKYHRNERVKESERRW